MLDGLVGNRVGTQRIFVVNSRGNFRHNSTNEEIHYMVNVTQKVLESFGVPALSMWELTKDLGASPRAFCTHTEMVAGRHY